MSLIGDGELGQRKAATADATVRRREILLLLLLASVQFTSIVDFMVVMPLGPQLMRILNLTPAHFGWIVSSYTIAAGLAGLLASSIMDQFGRKAAFLTLYAGFLIGTLLCGLAGSYYALLAARVVTGMFGGLLGGMALAIVGDVVPEERRGRATGLLMSAFAIASAFGVPIGLYLGTRFGWNVPFLILAALGVPVFVVAVWTMPTLRDHLHTVVPIRAFGQMFETFRHADHLRALALTLTLMLGSFTVIPFISAYLVFNVRLTEMELTVVFITGGILSLVGAPLIGRLADHFGKLLVYRVVASIAMVLILVITNLPPVPLAVAAAIVGVMMLTNAGRMVAALAMVTGSALPRRRGGLMSANSAVQHLAAGIGAAIGGKILVKSADGSFLYYGRVGFLAVVATLISLWIAGLVRPVATESSKTELVLEPNVDFAPAEIADAGDSFSEGMPSHAAELPKPGRSVSS
jgi:predicted MFS family arabinose efflux permease